MTVLKWIIQISHQGWKFKDLTVSTVLSVIPVGNGTRFYFDALLLSDRGIKIYPLPHLCQFSSKISWLVYVRLILYFFWGIISVRCTVSLLFGVSCLLPVLPDRGIYVQWTYFLYVNYYVYCNFSWRLEKGLLSSNRIWWKRLLNLIGRHLQEIWNGSSPR